MAEEKFDRKNPRKSTLETLEKMLGLARELGLEISDIAVSALALHMDGNSIVQVGSQLGITRGAANELIWRGLYELRKVEKALADIIDENKRLEEKNAMLAEENELMRQAIGKEEADVVISQQRLKKEATNIDEDLLKLLSTSVYQLNLDTKTQNALYFGGYYTLGDVVKCSRSTFQGFWGIGAKRLAELDKLIADAGLTYEYKI